jgi:hypothetical protein
MNNQNTNNKSIQLNRYGIEQVDNFKYLGSTMLSSTIDIEAHKNQICKAFLENEKFY